MNNVMKKKRLGGFIRSREITLVFLIIFLVLVVSTRYGKFLSPDNIGDIVMDSSILIIMTIAQMGVILIGGIDLSIASNMALTSYLVAQLHVINPGLPASVLILSALFLGMIFGLFNGILVALGNIPPVIATLGTISIYRGLTYFISQGEWISAHQMTSEFKYITKTHFLGLPALIWYMTAVSLVFYIFYSHIRTGREFYSVGGNADAAGYVGVSLKKIQILAFSISGALAGLGGLFYISKYAIAQTDTALGYEFKTISACVIGGVSLSGGVGTIPGVILGALFIGIVNNALPVINLSPFYQMALLGAIILVAVIYNKLADDRNQKFISRKREF